MSKVRATDTKPERVVRRTLHALGYRFRLYGRDLPGKPDIVLSRHRAVVFVHGCFWHHHTGCKKSRFPTTNVKFWKNKILRNVQRDRQTANRLRRSGWRVIVVWECETRNGKLTKRLRKLVEQRSSFRQTAPSTKTGRHIRHASKKK